ncbi:MAG: addiction module protein [Pyrinomonadaceae bacterium]
MSAITNIEELAFSLPIADRAKLAERLWQSIPEDYIGEEELEEVLRRDREMDENPESVMTHEEFFGSLREHIK